MSTEKKSVFRVVHNKNFTTVNNFICTDDRLSYKAKGIWLYAFSRPDDWKFFISDLVKQSKDKEKAVSSGLAELEKAGYLTKEKRKNDKGQYAGWDYIFYETPREIQKKIPKPQKAEVGKNRGRRNGVLLKTELLLNTEKEQQQTPTASKKKPAGGCVVFYKCLEGIDLTDKEKKSLMKHPEQEVKEAIAFVCRDGFEIKTTLIRALSWALKEKPELPKTVDVEKNFKLAVAAEFSLESLGWKVEAMPDKVIINCKSPNNATEHHVKYDNPNFKNELDKLLKKYEFKKSKK